MSSALNIMIAGIGGQGIVLASKIIAQAALARGLHVRTAETIGMAQRGGSVASHVRIGNEIHSPLIPRGTARVLLAFEPAEAIRHFPYLSADGAVIVCDMAIQPTADAYSVDAALSFLKENVRHLKIISGAALRRAMESVKTANMIMNMIMLGAASECGALPFSADELAAAIRALLPEKYWGINISAICAGRKACHD
ncbi:MAG: indolepyruvate oxidoreductase subunit beta [Clostridiales bacterium]|jgi:indolepyruvate ferredoxin oxidoreductase beta subunit|nr:indolepyruvate oxidoreductase subunit beta [Clostridiales bacterium]